MAGWSGGERDAVENRTAFHPPLPSLPPCFQIFKQLKLSAGMVLFGWANENHNSLAAVSFGVGLVTLATLIILVSVLAKASLDFHGRGGEVSALLTLGRVLRGFAVPYFQMDWAKSSGTLQVFGVEAAIVAALCFIAVPTLLIFWQIVAKSLQLPKKRLCKAFKERMVAKSKVFLVNSCIVIFPFDRVMLFFKGGREKRKKGARIEGEEGEGERENKRIRKGG